MLPGGGRCGGTGEGCGGGGGSDGTVVVEVVLVVAVVYRFLVLPTFLPNLAYPII